MSSLLKAALGYAASAYAKDAVIRPRQTGAVARAYCDSVRKPLLLIHGGGLAHRLLGAPVKADAVLQRAYPVQAAPGTFGAVLAVGVLQQLQYPERAMAEWHRVADKVFVVSPGWYNPEAWVAPGNRFLVNAEASRAKPLWTRRKNVVLLPMSDRDYNHARWKTMSPSTAPSTSFPTTTTMRPATSPADTTADLSPAASRQADVDLDLNSEIASESQSQNDPYGPSGLPFLDPASLLTEKGSSSGDEDDFALGNGPSESSPSVKTLMVVSRHES